MNTGLKFGLDPKVLNGMQLIPIESRVDLDRTDSECRCNQRLKRPMLEFPPHEPSQRRATQ